jgi:hypothetical protein
VTQAQIKDQRGRKYRSVIYLSGPDAGQLDDAETRCRAYAREFRWTVLKCTRDPGDRSALRQLIPQLDRLNVQIIVTDTLDMISADQDTRDGLLAAIERSRCIVHPVRVPCRARAAAGNDDGRGLL